jgi:hypothetical protein
MVGDAYVGARLNATDISGSLTAVAATDDQTLVTARNASTTIFIQRVIVYITTDAAQSWAFTDSNGTPVPVCKVTTSPGVDTRWDFDFGPRGMPLTVGKNFLLNMSAAGLAGTVNWYGYSKLTLPVALGTTA